MGTTRLVLSPADGTVFRLEYDENDTLVKISASHKHKKGKTSRVSAHQFKNRTVQGFSLDGGQLYIMKFGDDGLDSLPVIETKKVINDDSVRVVDIQSGIGFIIHYDLDGSVRFVDLDRTLNPAQDFMDPGMAPSRAASGKHLSPTDFINKTFITVAVDGGAVYELKYDIRGMQGIPQVTKKRIDEQFDFNNPNFIELSKEGKSDDKEVQAAFAEAKKQIDRMIGLTDAKEKMHQVLSNFKARKVRAQIGVKTPSPSLHLAFVGNPGTGKTTYARYYAKMLRAAGILDRGHVVEVDRSKLVGRYIGATEEKTRQVIESARGGVLIIDEFYALGVKSNGASGGEGEYGQRALEVILKVMEDDRDNIVIILTGYTKEMMQAIESNPGLKRRLAKIIEFPDYSAQELSDIFNMFAEDMSLSFDKEARAHIDKIILDGVKKKDRHFGNAGSIRNLIEEIQQRADTRLEAENFWDKAAAELDKKGKISAAMEKRAKTITLEDVLGCRLIADPASVEGNQLDDQDREPSIGFGRPLKGLAGEYNDKSSAQKPANDDQKEKPKALKNSQGTRNKAKGTGYNVG